MGDYLALGLFAFLVVSVTLVRHLVGMKGEGARSGNREEFAVMKQRRASAFLNLVAVPLLVGIFFFSIGVANWDARSKTDEPIVKSGVFFKHSLAYLAFLCETRPDRTPLAWHEIRLPWPDKEKINSSPIMKNTDSLPKEHHPPIILIFSSYS